MKKARGISSLLHDCRAYRQVQDDREMEPIHTYNNKKNGAVVIYRPKRERTFAQAHTVKSGFCDHEEPISLNHSHEIFETESYKYAPMEAEAHSYQYADDLDYYVEPFEEETSKNEDKLGTNKHRTPPLDPLQGYPKKKSQENPEYLIVTDDSKREPISPKPDAAERMPIMPDKTQENTLPMDEDRVFEEDIKTILKNKKAYDTFQKKAKPEAIKENSPSPSTAEAMNNPYHTKEHNIFEKIAQNMALAKTYDLGAISLENRFDSFEKDMEEQEYQLKKKKSLASANKTQKEKPGEKERKGTTTDEVSIGTKDFLDDLDKMANSPAESAYFSVDRALSPKNGGRFVQEDLLEVGDIILSTNDESKYSGLAEAETGVLVSRAQVYIGDGYLVQHLATGIAQRKLSDITASDRVTVALRHQDMTTGKATKIKTFLAQKIKEKAEYDAQAVVQDLPIQPIEAFCSTLSPSLEQKCREFAGRIFLGTATNNEFYCSELVLTALAAADLQIANTSPEWTAEDRLIAVNYNGSLRYVGHLKTT